MANPAERLAIISILIVEDKDESAIAMVLEEMLEDGGCSDVTVAANISLALPSIGQRVFSGVLLDMYLRDESPIVVAEDLARR